MSEDNQQIVVKRVRRVAAAHHGGAWKIAYADFVTAMMAFFLLMWLLSSTSQATREGIAEYFSTPLRVALSGGQNSADSSSISIQGGGKDISKASGQVKDGNSNSKKRTGVASTDKKLSAAETKDKVDLENLKKKIEEIIEDNPKLRIFKKQILLDITAEGLRIQIVDDQNRPMFDMSSAELKTYTKEILLYIGDELNKVDYRISVSGHTDAHQYGTGEKAFSNWELSANRANACRRTLVSGGMQEGKVIRVVGHANTINLDKEDPFSAINRRISIVVLNRKTEKTLMEEGKTVEVSQEKESMNIK